MTRDEVQARRSAIVAKHGEWSYDIPLTHDVWTRGNEGIPHTRLRRLLQAVVDLAGKPLAACRILDLACLEGQYAIECARQGATVVGLEAREANLVKARFAKEVLQLSHLEFVQDDVRNLSIDTYGQFDVVLCSGILYHLDTPDVFDLIRHTYEVTERLVIIDTHVSLRPNLAVEFAGQTYHGERLPERHAVAGDGSSKASEPPTTKELWASVGNEASFLFSRPSLLNALASAGFSSVHECLNPPHLNFGAPGIEHLNRCTFVAVKGSQVTLSTSPTANGLQEAWPEGALTYVPALGSGLEHLRTGFRRLASAGRKTVLRD